MSEAAPRQEPPASACAANPVSIVIPVYNQAEFTKTCLIALSRHTPGGLYEIIVVDNASSDGTQALLAGVSGNLQVIRNDRNLGFARACNQGARLARGEHLVFLNNDTAPFPGWLEALLREVQAPDVGVVGSKLLYPQTGLVQHAGMAIAVEDTLPVHLFRHMASDLPPLDAARDYEAVTGACLLIRRALFERLGGFDEAYLNGFEDVELCLRAREAGYRVRYAPTSVLYHCEGTSEGRFDRNQANYDLFRARWQGRFDEAGRLRGTTPSVAAQRADLALHAPLFAMNACGEEARALVASLGSELAVCDTGPHSAVLHQQLGAFEAAALEAVTRDAIGSARVRLQIAPLAAIARQGDGYQIARTSFPCDDVPAELAARGNAMDELWLPTDAHVALAKRAGVRAHLVTVPMGVDAGRFKRGLAPLPLPMRGPTLFLGVGEWHVRKGWAALLLAWARAFSSKDNVCLLLRVHPSGRTDNPYLAFEVEAAIDRLIGSCGLDRRALAPIVVMPEQLAAAAMPHLYAAVHACVAPVLAASWNRVALEALASGLPVIRGARDTEELAASLRRVVAEKPMAAETPVVDLNASFATMRARLRDLGL